MKTIEQCFFESELKSIKYSHYLQLYDEVFKRIEKRPITIVEVGILNGGSLEMWARYFGKHSHVIGIDSRLPEAAIEFFKEKENSADWARVTMVEGDAGDESFWREFYLNNPVVDVLIDDGGHSNKQQIVTLRAAIENLAPIGQYICEDVASSFMSDFGNPSKWSYLNYVHRLSEQITKSIVFDPKVGKSQTRLPKSIDLRTGFICMQIPGTSDLDIQVVSNGGRSTVEHGSFAPSIRIPFVGARNTAWIAQNIGTRNSTILNFLSRLSVRIIRRFENQKLRRYF